VAALSSLGRMEVGGRVIEGLAAPRPAVDSARNSEPLDRLSHSIPNFFILAISVVRLTPSFTAAPLAPPTTQSVSCSVFMIVSRSQYLRSGRATVSAILSL